MSKRKLENSNQDHHHDGESPTKQQTQWECQEDDDNTQTNLPNNNYSSAPKSKKQKNENHHPITPQIDRGDVSEYFSDHLTENQAPQQGEGEGGIIGGGTYLSDYFGDDQCSQQQQGSILTKFTPENNTIAVAEHVLTMLKLNDSKLYRKGCLSLVLGYFNKFKNGKEENIGEDYNDNIEIDDGKKIWHAEIIGNGGFGTVLKVTKRNTHTKEIEFIRAIKVIPNSTMGLSEAINAAKLNHHPNVVKVYNVMLIRNICCIEMEYIQCGSLADLIKKKNKKNKKNTLSNLTPKIIGKMLYQCCEVLSLMKQFGMVHSDIKPDNIMIRDYNDFNVAIGDFGLTLQNETIAKQSEGGTKKYLAPELFKNFKPTIHSDIFALGVTFQKLESRSLSSDKNVIKCLMGFLSDNIKKRESSFYDFVSTFNNTNSIWDNDEQYILYCLTNSKQFKVGERLRRNKKLIIEVVKQNGNSLQYADETLRKDREIVVEAVKQNGNALKYADKSFRKDREIVLEAVKQNGNSLEYADETLRKDREIVVEAVKQNGNSLQYADEIFRKDRKFVVEAVKQNGNSLQYADKTLRKDREIVLKAIKQNGNALEYADESIKQERKFILEMVKQHGCGGWVLEYCNGSFRSFRKDREIVLEVVKQNGNALQYAGKSLRKDREIVLKAVKQNAWALEYADESLKKDREFVLEAVKQNGDALEYINELLRNDREIVLEAVKQNGDALEYINESFRKDREIVLEAVKQNAFALVYVDESLRNDREFMSEALKQNEIQNKRSFLPYAFSNNN